MNAPIIPVVLDLGTQKRKALRALKNGEGPLMEEIARLLDEVRANSPELAGKELVPVVLICRKKSKGDSCCQPLPFCIGCK